MDTEIPDLANWPAEIEENIKKCYFFMLLVSDNSIDSDYVYKELRMALSHGKTIVLIEIPSRTKSIWHEISHIQMIRYDCLNDIEPILSAISDSNYKRQIEFLIHKIKQYIYLKDMRLAHVLPSLSVCWVHKDKVAFDLSNGPITQELLAEIETWISEALVDLNFKKYNVTVYLK
jgi:hypothetical protein